MEYRVLEARLAKLHQVNDEGIGAFRARLRVLRNMGVPPMPKVGKGARADFSADDFAELHLALTMSEFGLSPSRIVQIMGFIRTTPGWPPRIDTDKWLVIAMRANAGDLTNVAPDDALLRIGFISEGSLLFTLKSGASDSPATWQAVLSLRRIAEALQALE